MSMAGKNRKRLAFKRLPIIALLAVAMLASSLSANAQSETTMSQEQVAALVTPSIVYIQIDWSGYVGGSAPAGFAEKPNYWSREISLRFTCTGYVAAPDGYIATAGHCVDPGETRIDFINVALDQLVDEGVYSFRETEQMYDHALINWEIEGFEAGSPIERSVSVLQTQAASGVNVSQGFQAQVLEFRPLDEGDSALLKIQTTIAMPALAIATDDAPIGADVTAVGYPGSVSRAVDTGAAPSFKTGRVSSEQTYQGAPFTEIDAAMSGGMSGGPTVNANGEVIGVNSWGPRGESESFNFVTGTSSLRSILARNGVPLELGETDIAYREGLNAYFAGDYTTAIERFDRVLDDIPSHALAQRYRSEAREGERNTTTTTEAATTTTAEVTTTAQERQDDPIAAEVVDDDGFPWVWLAVPVLVLLAALYLLSQRQPATATPREKAITCTNCYTDNLSGSTYCNNCGQRLG